jgi:hypothetical protein
MAQGRNTVRKGTNKIRNTPNICEKLLELKKYDERNQILK